jgi:hypothetical protein
MRHHRATAVWIFSFVFFCAAAALECDPRRLALSKLP